MRLFIAIPLPEMIQEQIQAIQEHWKKEGITGRYILKEQLHITLVFIGETDQYETIASCLRSIPLPKTTLTLSKIGHFKDLVWIGLGEDAALETYVAALKNALRTQKIRFDPKPFKAHITLIRKASTLPKMEWLDLSFPLKESILYQSTFTKKGVHYTPLCIWDKTSL